MRQREGEQSLMPGPYLTAALTCETVLQEQDGVFSAIRIVDRFTATVRGPDVPDEMPPLGVQFTLFIILKAGDARGRFPLKLIPERPSGLQMPPIEFTMRFDGAPDQGQALVLPMSLPVEEEGLYWLDVFSAPGRDQADTLLTRVPVTIRYEPQRVTLE